MATTDTPEAIQKIIDLVRATGETIVHPQGGEVVLVPPGYTVHHLKPIDPPLSHIKQRVVFSDAKSFIAYVNEFKKDWTKIFVNINTHSVWSILDYHAALEHASDHEPGNCDHIATYAPKRHHAFTRWCEIDNCFLPQREFAEFIEDNLLDIIIPKDRAEGKPKAGFPSAAELLELATTLQVKKSIDIGSVINLSSGAVQIQFVEEGRASAKGRQTLEIPKKIAIAAPVFFGGEPYQIEAFLRYSADGPDAGGLRLKIKIERKEVIIQNAFEDAVSCISEETGITPLWATA